MADRTVARRYAQAFLSLAAELDAVARMGDDLDEVLDLVNAASGLLLNTLSNPVFTSEERRGSLEETIESVGVEIDPMTLNLLRLLIDRGRFSVLPDLVKFYHQAADDLAGRVRVEIVTAEPLGQALATEVRDALTQSTGREVVLDRRVDPELIGGLVARVGGKVYDASIRARLDDLKHRLILGQPIAEA